MWGVILLQTYNESSVIMKQTWHQIGLTSLWICFVLCWIWYVNLCLNIVRRLPFLWKKARIPVGNNVMFLLLLARARLAVWHGKHSSSNKSCSAEVSDKRNAVYTVNYWGSDVWCCAVKSLGFAFRHIIIIALYIWYVDHLATSSIIMGGFTSYFPIL